MFLRLGSLRIALILCYLAGLWFVAAQRDLFGPSEDHRPPGEAPPGPPAAVAGPAGDPADEEEEEGEPWEIRTSILALAGAGLAVGVMSEILVDSITETAEKDLR